MMGALSLPPHRPSAAADISSAAYVPAAAWDTRESQAAAGTTIAVLAASGAGLRHCCLADRRWDARAALWVQRQPLSSQHKGRSQSGGARPASVGGHSARMGAEMWSAVN